MGAGRHFKLDVKNRFLVLLAYYHLYTTYTLAGFLFDLDQSNTCRDVQNIKALVRKCVPIPHKIYNRLSKRLQIPEEVENYFPGFLSFIDCTGQQIPRPKNKIRRQTYFSGKKKKMLQRHSLWSTTTVSSSIKQTIRKDADTIMSL
jgi:hypothetical protein